MVAVVIGINLLIATGCWYVAWRVWKLRSALSKAADALVAAERATHRVLSGAPQGIGKGETGVYQLRQQYRLLEVKLLRVQQILKLLGLGQLVWQWYGKKLPLSSQSLSNQSLSNQSLSKQSPSKQAARGASKTGLAKSQKPSF
ncbi:MAG: hypothetical protein KME11_07145 [Timaviella obliquedivisa GSE-PSE-MK23-08B]|nr:hypothetical protein [Timaviella obliquedivisa GSE-PSE-MK23-08B]